MIDQPPEPGAVSERDDRDAEPIDPLVERALRRSSAARDRAPSATPAERRQQRRGSVAPAGRLVAAGAALGGTFLLVGAMAAATAPEPNPTPPAEPATIQRVVVTPSATTPPAEPIVIRVELPAAATATTTVPEPPTSTATTTPAAAPTPVVTSPPPPPPPTAPAPVVTESEGS